MVTFSLKEREKKMNKKSSGQKLSTQASKIMRSNNSSQIQKSLAASVLSQRNTGKITGKSAGYKPVSYTDKQGDVYTLPFRIFPTAQEEYIEIDIYREHEIIYTITQDNNFKKLHAPAGKQTDINIDFHYTPPLITMDVLPWANIHQDTEL